VRSSCCPKCIRTVHGGQIWAATTHLIFSSGSSRNSNTPSCQGRWRHASSLRHAKRSRAPSGGGMSTRELSQRWALPEHTIELPKQYLRQARCFQRWSCALLPLLARICTPSEIIYISLRNLISPLGRTVCQVRLNNPGNLR